MRAMVTDTVMVNVSDRFILQDNSNGNCLRLDACRGMYTIKTGSGTVYTGPVVITRSSATLSFQSGPGDPRTLQGSADLVQRTGTATLRISILQVFRIWTVTLTITAHVRSSGQWPGVSHFDLATGPL